MSYIYSEATIVIFYVLFQHVLVGKGGNISVVNFINFLSFLNYSVLLTLSEHA